MYVDESGNTGSISSGGSLTYSLGAVIVTADVWPGVLDNLVSFRRRLRDRYGIPMRDELKANYLLRSSGTIRRFDLAPGERHVIYRAHLRVLRDLPARAFAVVIDKRPGSLNTVEVFDRAWRLLLERLERMSSKESSPLLIMHDEGENDAIRRWARRARRHLTAGSHYGTGMLNNPMRHLIDDPVPRRSDHSYMIQFADLVAYAGFRAVVEPGKGVGAVCPGGMWSEIGPATHTAVNRLSGGTPGVLVR